LITVTFLVPVFAVVMGALMLGEPITASMIVGGAIILLGTGMSTRYR
jgi:drug/metabolite transporter (DMT)-like permease